MAITEVLLGKMYFSAEINNVSNNLIATGQAPTITRREKEILEMIAQGMTNHFIADKIFISPHTVDTHRKNLLVKFEVGNTAQLIKKASEFGLV